MTVVNILEPIQISCLIVGAMMPYAFSALTMSSVGKAAEKMCEEIMRQHNIKLRSSKQDQFKFDYEKCIDISTVSSLTEMIIPGVMVIFTPLVIGGVFGPKAVSGYLAGVIVSGVQMAIASSNSGGAWDNAKKYIESRQLPVNMKDKDEVEDLRKQMTKIAKKYKHEYEEKKREGEDVSHMDLPRVDCEAWAEDELRFYGKKTKPHKSAVVGDTVGDPLKDTSGPSLNILIKLSAIVSLIFGSFFANHSIYSF
jgi:Na+/H+-translocating membrane pyrophosphatase